MKCRHREGTSRAIFAALQVVLLAGLIVTAAPSWAADGRPIVPRDAAARPYDAGRLAVQRGDFAAGIRLLDEALATGYTRPEDRMGASRYFVERYDPYYWLGRAYMELGNDARARENLLRSKAGGLIQAWPEFADLSSRLATLDAREAASKAAAAPTPVPTPTAAPPPPPTATPLPAVVPSPPVPSATTGSAVPVSPQTVVGLDRLVRAISEGDMVAAEAALAVARKQAPDARSLDLLEAVVAGTRFVLAGGKDESLLLRARASLGAFRAKGGGKKAEEMWLSPGLLALLGRR